MKYLGILSLALIAILFSCAKDVGILPQAPPLTDSALYSMAKSPSDKHTWKSTTSNPDSIFTTVAAHGSVPYKLLLNTIAKNACTDNGKLPVNGTFPDSSLVVKVLYNASQTAITQYAVMYKENGGWRWGEYNSNGNVDFSINQSSDLCTGCHTSSRDKTWTFVSH